MNLREITLDEARKLPSGSELWVGQTRQTAVKGGACGPDCDHVVSVTIIGRHRDAMPYANDELKALGVKLFLPTREAVKIEPDEAMWRCANNLPVNGRIAWDKEGRWNPIRIQRWRAIQSMNAIGVWSDCSLDEWVFEIPAIPEPKRRSGRSRCGEGVGGGVR